MAAKLYQNRPRCAPGYRIACFRGGVPPPAEKGAKESNMFRRIGDWLRRFMWGRYGGDKLNVFLTVAALVVCLAGGIVSRLGVVGALIGLVLDILTYALLFFALFRMLSRNLDARRREYNRFMNLTAALRDRKNRYFRCPHCKQTVRVPKGRGKICIKCPKCGEKFVRKS